MDTLTSEYVRACSLDELKAKGRLVVHGRHPPSAVLTTRLSPIEWRVLVA